MAQVTAWLQWLKPCNTNRAGSEALRVYYNGLYIEIQP
jgi:hypothetical protein